jgi:hypothetical protein
MAPAATGTRNRLVTIQHGTTSTGDSGGPVDTFVDTVPPIWMAREIASRGGEVWQADATQVAARAEHRWSLPYLPDMDPDVVDVPRLRRLVYQGRTYDIVDAHKTRSDEITLTTRVKTDAAQV